MERRFWVPSSSGFADHPYGLIDKEVELLWKTAPPRMPRFV